jgi:hypothetical protein
MLEHLNDRRIAALPVPTREERQHDYWDDTLRGFGVHVSYGGKRAFVVRYRVGGRLRRLTLGPYPGLSLADARRKAKEVLGDVARGTRPRRSSVVVTAFASAISSRSTSTWRRSVIVAGTKSSASSTRIFCPPSVGAC